MVTFNQKICPFWIMISKSFFAEFTGLKPDSMKWFWKVRPSGGLLENFRFLEFSACIPNATAPLALCLWHLCWYFLNWNQSKILQPNADSITCWLGSVAKGFLSSFFLSVSFHPLGRMILINDSLENSHKSVPQLYCGVRKMGEGWCKVFILCHQSGHSRTKRHLSTGANPSLRAETIQWKLRVWGTCELNGGHIRRTAYK